MLLAFLPQFETYQADLKRKKGRTLEENYVLTAIGILIDYLRKDYKLTLATFKNLTSHGEINYELLYALLVPRSTLVTTCPVTKEPRALELISVNKVKTLSGFFYDLLCESIDAVDDDGSYSNNWGNDHSAAAEVRRVTSGLTFGSTLR